MNIIKEFFNHFLNYKPNKKNLIKEFRKQEIACLKRIINRANKYVKRSSILGRFSYFMNILLKFIVNNNY
jgi:hypothetical protein